MATETRSQQTIQSLDKGLQVLEMIGEAGGPLTLQDIWKKLHWNKATILRILNTFVARGYLRRDGRAKAYTIGIRILALYTSLSDNLNIRQLMRPYLEDLVAETGETAQVGIVVNGKVVFIDRVRGRNIISANTEIGQTLPLHSTAIGKAYLAYIQPEDVKELLRPPLAKYTSRTMSSLDKLESDLEKIRRRGYSLDLGEYVDELRCIAAPILDHTGHPIAMIGISGPKSGLSQQKCDSFGRVVKRMAEQISAEIGNTSDDEG